MEVKLENDTIIISLPIENIPAVVEGSWASGFMETRMKVSNAEAFARDLLHALNAEQEDGTTVVHRMFDKAIDDAIEQGAQGIEDHEDQEA